VVYYADFVVDPENPSISVGPVEFDKHPNSAEIYEGEDEWDDELDGEGEVDPAWDVDHDAQSNESSTTLSSTMSSSKRAFGQVEADEHDLEDDTPTVSGTFIAKVLVLFLMTSYRTKTTASSMTSHGTTYVSAVIIP
jgi:hypothetical protein